MKNVLVVISILFIASGAALRAEEGPQIQGLRAYKLANGLQVYAYRDAAVPLVRVQIAFRAGAISQTPETAGLFRLYERTLFGGLPSQPGSPSLKAALSSLGLSEMSGGVGKESTGYWLTVPSADIARALGLLAGLFVSPSIDEKTLEAQRTALIQDLRSRTADPNAIYQAALEERLFPKFPWTRDPAGSEKALGSATLDSLKTLAARWLIPNNAAIFVGGDIDPDEIQAEVRRAFSTWQSGPDPWVKDLPQNPRPGVMRPTWLVFPDPSMPEGTGFVEARYRGPDLAFDPKSSYAADLWTALVAPPEGRFKATIEANVPKLGGADGITADYVSQRDGGWISISSFFVVDPALPAVDRARAFKERERAYEITSMKTDPSYFSPADYEAARKRILSSREGATGDAEAMIGTLAFWWAASSLDYFAGYPAVLAATGPKEVSAFLDTYVMRNLEVVALRMNPADYEREKASFAGSGFEAIRSSNAFWWQK